MPNVIIDTGQLLTNGLALSIIFILTKVQEVGWESGAVLRWLLCLKKTSITHHPSGPVTNFLI